MRTMMKSVLAAAALAISAAGSSAPASAQESAYGPTDAGYVTLDGNGYTYHGSGHLVGTHRMGDDPVTSVVDDRQRSWDHENLYVVGAGSSPTIATSNPTLTLTALALRAADGMLGDLGEGRP